MRLALVCTEFTTVPPIKGGAVQTHIGGIGPLLGRVHDTTIVCTEDPDLPVNELHDGLRYLRLPAQSDESYLQQVAEVIRRKQFDLVHVFNRPKWIVPLGVAAPDARLFLRVHDEMFIPRKIDPNEAHAAIERLSGIDTVSDYLARKIAALYPNARPKLRTIYTGVDLDRFQPPWTAQGAALRQAVREELAIGPNPVILFAGRLSQTKGPDLLLEAMRHVVKRFPRAVLLIVGSR